MLGFIGAVVVFAAGVFVGVYFKDKILTWYDAVVAKI